VRSAKWQVTFNAISLPTHRGRKKLAKRKWKAAGKSVGGDRSVYGTEWKVLQYLCCSLLQFVFVAIVIVIAILLSALRRREKIQCIDDGKSLETAKYKNLKKL